MFNFKNMPLKNKLWFFSLFFLFSVLTSNVVSFCVTKKLGVDTENLADIQIPSVRSMTLIDMMHDGLRAVVLESYLSALEKKENMKEVIAEAQEKNELMLGYMNELAKLELNPEIRKQVDSSIGDVKKYTDLSMEMVNLASKGDLVAFKSKQEEFQAQFEILEDKLGGLGDQIIEGAKVIQDESHQVMQITTLTLISLSISLLIFGLIFSKWFINSIISRLNPLTAMVQDINQGKYELNYNDTWTDELQTLGMAIQNIGRKISEQLNAVKVALANAEEAKQHAEKAMIEASNEQKKAQVAMEKAVSASDLAEKEKQVANQERVKAEEAVSQAQAAMKSAETEKSAADLERTRAREMAEKEQQFAKELQLKIDHILDCVSAAENGDLTKDIQVFGDDVIGKLGNGLRSLFRQLSQNMMTIGEMASILASQSEVLSQANNEMSSNATNTLDNSVNLEKKSKTVYSNMKSLTTSTGEMKIGVNEVAKQSSETSKIAKDAVGLVVDVREVSEKLSVNAEDISKFIAVINSIARQTNLLALNATIEAARAGEAGKGFAIVANEVKELAKQSGNAADEINQKVGVIMSNTKGVMNSVESVSSLMDKLNQASGIVAAATEQQFATTEQFAGYINKSTIEVEQMNDAVAVIKQSAQSTSELIRSNSQLSVQLADAAEQLSKVVRRFKIKADSGSHLNRKAA